MSDMSLIETTERFKEGLKKAISRSKELAGSQNNLKWLEIAKGLEGILYKGESIFRSKALTRQETLSMVEQAVSKMKIDG